MSSSESHTMTLGALCADAQLSCPPGAADTVIRGVTTDSRRVGPGFLFAALPGLHRDGRDCIPDAAARGAAAAAAAWDDNDCPTAISGAPIPLVRVTEPRAASAFLLDAWYGHPGRRLRLVGITGTNGKTSTACMLTHILRAAGERVGMIGTLGYTLPDDLTEPESGVIRPQDERAAMTTPDPEELYAILDRMAQVPDGRDRRTTVVMEVSSHALALGKAAPLHFDVGVFTNLFPEHLDFHGTMDDYFEAKKQLLRQSDVGVTNGDDRYGARLPLEVTGPRRWLVCRGGTGAYGTVCPGVPCERVDADRIRQDGLSGVEYRLICPAARLHIRCPVPGEFTVRNSHEAAAAALALGVPPLTVRDALSGFGGVPGRMERLPVDADFSVFIDYAHTPDALEKLLAAFHRIRADGRTERGRIILLFGCGGDRDRDKRRAMARIASAMADVTVITSDNSRSEDPAAIIGDILRGIDKESEYTVIPDRAEAIRCAVRLARPGDVILLCGKGHETYEIDRTGRHPFDERAVVRAAVQSRRD